MNDVTVDTDREVLAHQLDGALSKLGLALSSKQVQQLFQYLVLIEKWNRIYNITSIRKAGKIISVHLLDSLSVIPYVTGKHLLDVGSGAGLPGIPLAIAGPSFEVTLLDSGHKKAAFLQQAVAELGLRNAEVVCERVEDWHPNKKFDFIISRAFSELAEFVALTGHLLSLNGVFAAMKGAEPVEELKRLPAGFRIKSVLPIAVPTLDAKRHLVLIERSG